MAARRTHLLRSSLALLAMLSLVDHQPLAAQAPSLDDVLTRVASYLEQYVPRLARVVATEDYEQRIAQSTSTGTGSGKVAQFWRLKSEVLLVRYPVGDVDWMWFRDVSEADGKRLPHDPDRLVKLFVTPNADAAQQASRISYEGFRYNLGGATVPATNPVLVVALMQAGYQPRLRFKLGGAETSLGPNVRAIKYEEREEAEPIAGRTGRTKLPMLLDPAGRIRGTAWVDTRTGEIVKTEAQIGELNKLTTTTATFAQEPRLLLLVPKEMRTKWTYVRGGPVIGVAKYSNFRQFGVTTDAPAVQLPQVPR
jgi:hypothetical protein